MSSYTSKTRTWQDICPDRVDAGKGSSAYDGGHTLLKACVSITAAVLRRETLTTTYHAQCLYCGLEVACTQEHDEAGNGQVQIKLAVYEDLLSSQLSSLAYETHQARRHSPEDSNSPILMRVLPLP